MELNLEIGGIVYFRVSGCLGFSRSGSGKTLSATRIPLNPIKSVTSSGDESKKNVKEIGSRAKKRAEDFLTPWRNNNDTSYKFDVNVYL